MSAESQMLHELIDQVSWNCTILTAAKEIAESSDEICEIEKTIESCKAVIARAHETLKTVAKYE